MGRITSWLKTCFGFKKKEKENEEKSMISSTTNSGNGRRNNERLRRETSSTTTPSLTADQSKQAIAMVVATVAAAEAVIASADAAIAMYRRLLNESMVTALQSSAATKIQSVYRGHLARRARGALKSLVRIQALFRGYMVRKRMQAFMRAKEYCVHANGTYGFACQPERSKQRLSRSTSSSSRLVAQHSRPQLLSSEYQCPHGFFKSYDREFHVASLPYAPDSKVMSDCVTTGDHNVAHSEVSIKGDEKYNKMKMPKGIKRHKHSLRQPSEGWSSRVNERGSLSQGKNVGSLQDGSTRPLNQYKKMSTRRETPRQRQRILPSF